MHKTSGKQPAMDAGREEQGMAAINRFAVRLISEANREEGQSMAEYGLILAGVAVLVMGAVAILGGSISGVFTDVTGALGKK